jgi:hypothetical protein
MEHRLEESVVSRMQWADADWCWQTNVVATHRSSVEAGMRQLVDDLAAVPLEPMDIAMRRPA